MLAPLVAVAVAMVLAWWSWRGRLQNPIARWAAAARFVALLALLLYCCEVGEACEPEFVGAMHPGMARERRLKAKCLSRVGANAFGTPSHHISVLREERNQLWIRARNVRAILFDVQERRRVRALRP